MWEDGWNDGLSEGLNQGRIEGLEQGISLSAAVFRAIHSGLSDNRAIADFCNCTAGEVENIKKAFDI